MKKTPAKIKRPLWVVGLNLALALTVGSTQAFATDINSVEDLLTVSGNANYVLKVDLDLSIDDASSAEGEQLADVETSGDPSYISNGFTGTFNGGGFTISGLTKPLFDASSGDILNLNLVSTVGIDGNGALANIREGGTIDSVSFTGDISGESGNYGMLPVGIGGLVGLQIGGTISNSYAAGTVDGDNYVGGLVGITDSDISNSSVTGNVSGIDNVGGLVGYSEGTITDSSYATGDVTGNDNVGGLVGVSLGTISNSYATGDVTGSGEYIGGLVGWLEAGATISNSYAKTGTVTGTGTYDGDFWEGGFDEGDHGIGGLVGYSSGYISDSYAEGDVNGFKQVGGLVGSTGVATYITDSYATGNVGGTYDVGGLVGLLDLGHTIADSYATGNVTGEDNFGGLVGSSEGDIDNSYATGDVTSISAGCECGDAGGLVGYSDGGITNSYASGDVRGGEYDIGGLVGDLEEFGSITNSYATGNVEGIGKVGGLVGELNGDITNSYATGNVDGTNDVGGLVGDLEGLGSITNSYATGNVDGTNDVGGLVGFSESDITGSYGYGEATINGAPIGEDPHLGEGDAPEILSIVNFGFADPNLPFAVSASINDGFPYLISLIESYDVAVTPSFNLRSYYTQAAKSLNKALAPFGFKSNFSSHPNLGFKELEQNQSNSPAVIQLFEVSEYQNSNILLNKEDGFQLSISSYYKEAVEIWTQGLNGEYLYLGLVEFDKDGKAILPTLKFDTANTYQLLMIKAADKLNEKPNLEAKVGQININVF